MKVFTNRATAEENARFWAGLLAALGGCSGTAFVIRSWSFGIAGQALTSRLRKLSFRHILKQVKYIYIYIYLSTYISTYNTNIITINHRL